jgi:DNA-binding transcriptional MerR regulator
MTLMTIGQFARRTRLSPKALRLYDQLGLVVPARVDASSAYRLYSEDQVEAARLAGLLRRLDMPLAVIASVLEAGPVGAAGLISEYWSQVEAVMADRRALVGYLQQRLTGVVMTRYAIELRSMPERKLLTISRHLTADATDAFFDDAFGRLRAAAPGIDGIAGCPYLVFYGEVSEDSDGPLELCRPVAPGSAEAVVAGQADIQFRVEREHDEAYIRLALKDAPWPAMLPAYDALVGWVTEQQREASSAPRQVLIADQRAAAPGTPVCDLAIPLR